MISRIVIDNNDYHVSPSWFEYQPVCAGRTIKVNLKNCKWIAFVATHSNFFKPVLRVQKDRHDSKGVQSWL